MSQLVTRALGVDDYASYDRLISDQGSVFATRKWLSLLNQKTCILGMFDGSNNLLGVFPICESKRMWMKVVLRPSFTQAFGPYFSDELLQSKNTKTDQRYFVTEISEYLRRKNYAVCCISLDSGFQDVLPFRWRGYKVVPGFTYRITLEQTEEQIFKGMSSTRRRNIRAAVRDEIDIQQVDSYEIVEQLALNTFSRQSKKLPIERLRKILYEFAKPENSFAFVAYQDKRPISCVFCIFDKKSAYYLIGGYDEGNAHHGAGAACMQAAIFKAKAIGLKVFDFEGSVIPAIEKYFCGFGGELTPYYTINRAWLPIEVLLKLRNRELF